MWRAPLHFRTPAHTPGPCGEQVVCNNAFQSRFGLFPLAGLLAPGGCKGVGRSLNKSKRQVPKRVALDPSGGHRAAAIQRWTGTLAPSKSALLFGLPPKAHRQVRYDQTFGAAAVVFQEGQRGRLEEPGTTSKAGHEKRAAQRKK